MIVATVRVDITFDVLAADVIALDDYVDSAQKRIARALPKEGKKAAGVRVRSVNIYGRVPFMLAREGGEA